MRARQFFMNKTSVGHSILLATSVVVCLHSTHPFPFFYCGFNADQDQANNFIRKTSGNTICVLRHPDSSEHGTKQAGIDEVLEAFKALENGVQRTTASDDASYIVPAPVSSTCADQNYFVYKFSGVSMPDFFISLGHQLRGDPLRSSCVVKPLTSSRNPQS
ncbi:hypothetical protein MRX96_028713 [Rhipicephalus microplus]